VGLKPLGYITATNQASQLMNLCSLANLEIAAVIKATLVAKQSTTITTRTINKAAMNILFD
jgi:hypothetical protein